MLQPVGEPARRTPRNTNPPLWSGEGNRQTSWGMPTVSSTGLKGGRSYSRAQRTAKNFGLDQEMLRVAS